MHFDAVVAANCCLYYQASPFVQVAGGCCLRYFVVAVVEPMAPSCCLAFWPVPETMTEQDSLLGVTFLPLAILSSATLDVEVKNMGHDTLVHRVVVEAPAAAVPWH